MVDFGVFVVDPAAGANAESADRLAQAMRAFCDGRVHMRLSQGAVFFAHSVNSRAGSDVSCPIFCPSEGSLVAGDVRVDRVSALEGMGGRGLEENTVPTDSKHLRALWRAYRVAGEQGFSTLSGSFACVLWDAYAERLLAVRDGMGEVPLYVARVPGGRVLSNHLPIVLRCLDHSSTLRAGAIVRRIVGINQRELTTEYEQIERVPAGSVWQLNSAGGERTRRYWTLRSTEGSATGTFSDNARLFRETFEASVRDRLPTDGPVAVELSGGLDSSSVSGVVAHYARDRTRTYSAIFPGIAQSDEEQFICAAARHQGVHNHRFSALELDWASSFDASLRASGRFVMAANIHINKNIYDLARADGCSVVFNGIDGDNVASHGFYQLAELANAGNWSAFANQVRRVEDLFGGNRAAVRGGLYGRFARPALRERFRRRSVFDLQLINALVQLRLRLGIGARSLLAGVVRSGASPGLGSLPKNWFNPELVDATEWGDLEREQINSAGPFLSEREAMLAVLEGCTELYFESTYPVAAASGLRIAAPFMDREVLQLCINMPSEYKLHGAWNRAFMREGLSMYMGEKVAWRRWKSDLSFGLAPYFAGIVLPRVRELVAHPSDNVWTTFSHTKVREDIATILSSCGPEATFGGLHQLIISVYTLHRFLELGNGIRSDVGKQAPH